MDQFENHFICDVSELHIHAQHFTRHPTEDQDFAQARVFGRALKMASDFIVALLLLAVLSPLMLIIAAMVMSDGGPILFGHERLGVAGRRFKCLKFRTMVVDSPRVLENLLANDAQAAAEWNETQKLRNDPRITAVGRLLRSTSLDELPQLFNILLGHMSLVGPRPIVEAEVRRYSNDILFYYATRPGITGLWQISGRSETSYAQRVSLDVSYVKDWSPWRDIAILIKTVPAVLFRRGAV